jgi:hypothetical protein
LIEDLAKARLIAFPLGVQWIIPGDRSRGFATRCPDFAASPPDVRKVSDLPIATELILGLRPIFEMNKFQISRDSQALYITMVAKDVCPSFKLTLLRK